MNGAVILTYIAFYAWISIAIWRSWMRDMKIDASNAPGGGRAAILTVAVLWPIAFVVGALALGVILIAMARDALRIRR